MGNILRISSGWLFVFAPCAKILHLANGDRHVPVAGEGAGAAEILVAKNAAGTNSGINNKVIIVLGEQQQSAPSYKLDIYSVCISYCVFFNDGLTDNVLKSLKINNIYIITPFF